MLKALDVDRCVGAVVCKLHVYQDNLIRGYIAMLAVDKEYRRRGIGMKCRLSVISIIWLAEVLGCSISPVRCHICYSVTIRVRTILVLGYWVLGSICRYWVVLLLGDISVHCDTQYDTDETAVSIIHMITILMSVVRPLSADDGREG